MKSYYNMENNCEHECLCIDHNHQCRFCDKYFGKITRYIIIGISRYVDIKKIIGLYNYKETVIHEAKKFIEENNEDWEIEIHKIVCDLGGGENVIEDSKISCL